MPISSINGIFENSEEVPAPKNRAVRDRVAVLIPCYNEEAAIAQVVASFRAALPESAIYVYDNNSQDRTKDVAREAGAIVRSEPLQGKGHVVRRMFADVEADVYVLVDGDATYDAPSARRMMDRLETENLDMVVAERIEHDESAYRLGHRAGNILLTGLISVMFGRTVIDLLSGYRVLSHRFVKSFPVLSGGFEIETELTVHALELDLPIAEVKTPYYARPANSCSKLNTWRDGFGIYIRLASYSYLCHLRGRGNRAAPADGGVIDRNDVAGVHVHHLGAGAGHSDARAPRDEASGLSRSECCLQPAYRISEQHLTLEGILAAPDRGGILGEVHWACRS
jgi:glycosyltransferase involved in cell wall biosynthesis